MGKYETKYNSEWEKTYDWLSKIKDNIFAAKCKLCGISIQVNNGGLSQIRSHANTKKHMSVVATVNNHTSQTTLVPISGGIQLNTSKQFDQPTETFFLKFFVITGRLYFMSMDDQVLRAEILWELKCVKSIFSFASNSGNNDLFSAMFPDSKIAKSYKMSETKCKYLIQFGVSPWILEDLKKDIKASPFSYLFDETTTVQVKKQYDAYVRYESKRHGEIVDRYCGSLFLGHCDANHLVTNFYDFGRRMDWEIDYLLQIGMDGPRTNLSFNKKLVADLKEKHEKSIIDIGTCNIHKIHNSFKKGLQKLQFDFDGCAADLHFFFKHSSARRMDFQLMELITEIEAEYMLRHVSSRWLSLKKVKNRILDQWQNLREYFLQFLPSQKHFSKDVETTDRYQRIRKILNSGTSKLYLSFAVYIADILENFIIPFQCSKPMIQVLYPAIGDLFFKLMDNFVKPKVLTTSSNEKKDAQALGVVDINKQENLLSIHKMDFGSKAAYQIGLLESKSNIDIIKTEFKMAFIELTLYLQDNLPHENPLLKNLQYIHPSKVRHINAVPAIRKLAPTIARTLKGSNFTSLSVDR